MVNRRLRELSEGLWHCNTYCVDGFSSPRDTGCAYEPISVATITGTGLHDVWWYLLSGFSAITTHGDISITGHLDIFEYEHLAMILTLQLRLLNGADLRTVDISAPADRKHCCYQRHRYTHEIPLGITIGPRSFTEAAASWLGSDQWRAVHPNFAGGKRAQRKFHLSR
jgi:hypothetical protein